MTDTAPNAKKHSNPIAANHNRAGYISIATTEFLQFIADVIKSAVICMNEGTEINVASIVAKSAESFLGMFLPNTCSFVIYRKHSKSIDIKYSRVKYRKHGKSIDFIFIDLQKVVRVGANETTHDGQTVFLW